MLRSSLCNYSDLCNYIPFKGTISGVAQTEDNSNNTN